LIFSFPKFKYYFYIKTPEKSNIILKLKIKPINHINPKKYDQVSKLEKA